MTALFYTQLTKFWWNQSHHIFICKQ